MCVSRALQCCCPSFVPRPCVCVCVPYWAGRENAFRFMTCTKFNFISFYFLNMLLSLSVSYLYLVCCHSSEPLLQWSAIFYLCLASLRGIELISMTRPLSGLSQPLSLSISLSLPLFISRVHWRTPLDFGFCVCVFNKRLSSEPSVSWPLFN